MSDQTLYCLCGVVFRGFSRTRMDPPRIESNRPCPGCGGTRMQRASTDPEPFVVGASEVSEGCDRAADVFGAAKGEE